MSEGHLRSMSLEILLLPHTLILVEINELVLKISCMLILDQCYSFSQLGFS